MQGRREKNDRMAIEKCQRLFLGWSPHPSSGFWNLPPCLPSPPPPGTRVKFSPWQLLAICGYSSTLQGTRRSAHGPKTPVDFRVSPVLPTLSHFHGSSSWSVSTLESQQVPLWRLSTSCHPSAWEFMCPWAAPNRGLEIHKHKYSSSPVSDIDKSYGSPRSPLQD